MDRACVTGPDGGFVDEFLDACDYITAHTSGSTGEPKPIRLLKSDMIESAVATCRHFGIDRNSHLVCPLSTDYIAGKMMVVRALVSGAHLNLLPPSANPLAQYRGSAVIDLLPVVPTQLHALLDDARNLPLIRNLLIGGGALDSGMARKIGLAGVNAWESYGMTETCSHVAIRRVGQSHFTAMPGISFSTDGRGCLIVDVPRMSVRQVVTNDVVEILSPAEFRWLGRHDNVINSGGIKIHPEIDEKILDPHLPDTVFYITSRPSDRWGREAVMVVVSSPLSDTEILGIARRELPPFHVPKDIIRDQSPSFTSSGKLKRRIF